MLRTLIAATLVLALPMAVVAADVTAQQVVDGKDREAIKVYAKGVGTGILASNTYLTHIRQNEMFCLPPGLTLTPEQYISSIEELLKRRPHAATEPAPVVMVIALIDMFPCK